MGGRSTCETRSKPGSRGLGHGHYPVRPQTKPFHHLLAHRLAGRHDHGRDPQFQQHGRAPAHSVGGINMLAEQESTAAIRMLQRISERLGIASDTVDHALAEETDVERIVTAIDQTVPS